VNASDITVVTVTYASIHVLPQMVESIDKHSQVIVVDNGPRDGTERWCAERGITWLGMPENLGFGRGCNEGFAYVKTPWVLFLNPDASLMPDCLEKLISAAEKHPSVVAFGPVHLTHSGPAWFKRRSGISKERVYTTTPPHTPVPFMSGAAMLIRSEAFREACGFDPEIFLYFEDDDLSLRLHQAHGPLMLVHDAGISHGGGQSSAPTLAISEFKEYHFGKSEIYVLNKYFGRVTAFWKVILHACKILNLNNIFVRDKRKRWYNRLRGMASSISKVNSSRLKELKL
jgi:N-acetylglucosaminyl-diphospho-decaprenol L-rhamnosyltransferase